MLTLDCPRVAVLCSGRAPGLLHLIARSRRPGAAFEIVCCVTSEVAFEGEVDVIAAGVPVLHHPRVGDLTARPKYDARTVDLLAPYHADLVVLAGYLLLLTSPMLNAYPHRIINVHHSDLGQRDAAGAPRYPGLRAVRDAILAGESETRSSAHIVTADLDDGPVLLRSRPYPVPEIARWALLQGEHDVLRRVIWAHQEWMLRDAFGPLMEHAVERMALLEGAR
jgi:phosphoribosylglycinamide formyltransferase-1